MSLILVESFEAPPTAEKWNWGSVPSYATVPRTGSRSMQLGYTAQRLLTATEEHVTLIAGMAFRFNTALSSSGIPYFFQFYSDAGTTVHVAIGINISTRAIEVRRGDYSTGTLLGSSTWVAPIDGLYRYIEAKAALHDSTGEVVVKIDGSTVLTLTGQDTKNGGTKTVFDGVAFHVPQQTSSQANYADDFYLCNGAGTVNNDFLGPVKIETLYPSGNGNSSMGVGSDADSTDNYLLVDETGTPVTTDYVEFATTGDKDTYAFTDLTTTSGVVRGVVANMHAYKSDAGAREVRAVARRLSTVWTQPGTTGNYVSTPDSDAVSVTSAIDIRAKAAVGDWSSLNAFKFATKWGSAPQRSFTFATSTTLAGGLALNLSEGGEFTTTRASSQAAGFVNGTAHWVRATWRASDGRVQFFTSDDYDPETEAGTWTQLGVDESITYSSIKDSSSPVWVGESSANSGQIHYVELRNGIDGPIVAKFDPSGIVIAGTRDPATLVSSTGETWTMVGSAWDWASNATESTATPEITLANASYRTPYAVFEEKPGGGTWTIADVNDAEFGVEAT